MAQRVGVPAAFIESAWRRYTKHSRAKAQEMQGAIEPLLLAHQAAKPFAGAIVGGEWTSASLTQLRSVGFTVVHLSFSEIVAAFGTVGIDVATEEGTPLPVLQAAVDACDGMSQADKDRVGDELRACAAADFADFRARLAGAVLRKVERVTLTDKSYPALNYWTVASAGWDNAAEIFVKAIDILAEGGSPHIPAIRESLKVTNTPKVDPPKFDPKQAIWDAGGWPILKDRSVSIVGEDAKVYFEYGGMGYIVERDPDLERVLTGIDPIKNPRHVDTDRYRVIAVLPNRVYVAKKNGTDSWVVFTKDSRTSDTTIYYHYDSAVKDAINFSQETS